MERYLNWVYLPDVPRLGRDASPKYVIELATENTWGPFARDPRPTRTSDFHLNCMVAFGTITAVEINPKE
jgi:hypothetical protein